MSKHTDLSRRQVLTASGNLFLGAALAAILPPRPTAAAATLTIAFLYEGSKHDFGWNQAHAVAAQKIAQATGGRLIEQENVP
jgi:basic membrane protein A and related proteins